MSTNLILYYNDDTGAGAVGSIDSQGNHTTLKSYGDFAKGWSHIVNIANGMLFYNVNTGTAAIGKLDAAGNFSTVKTLSGFSLGWSHIVNTANGIFFYNVNTGTAAIGKLDAAGNFSTVKTLSGFSLGWSHIVNTANGIFFYNANTGTAAIGKLDAAGNFSTVKTLSGFSLGWSHIVNTANGIFFYNVNTGTAAIGKLDAAGNFSTVKTLSGFSLGWSHIVNTANGIFFYNANTGTAAIGKLDAAGNFSTVKTLSGFSLGWSHIVNTANGMLFYNANIRAAAVGTVDTSGNFHTLKEYGVKSFSTWTNIASESAGRRAYLLILAPQEFVGAVLPLAEHKNRTGISTIVCSLEDIYQTYSGVDEAEKVKRCLAWYQLTCQIRYAMLVGDCDRFPVRYTKWFNARSETEQDPEFRTLYVPTDLYYAALFKEIGSFDDWNANQDSYFGEVPSDQSTSSANPDAVYGVPFLAVGRVLASTVEEVKVYVSKVIDYEKGAYDPYRAKAALLIATTDSDVDDCKVQEDIATKYLAKAQFTKVYKLYQAENTGCVGVEAESPNPTKINDYMNQGVELVSYLGHGNTRKWAIPNGEYTPYHMKDLHNEGKLPIVFSAGCDTAQFTPLPPKSRYMDVDGKLHWGTDDQEVFNSTPPQPACLQPSDNVDLNYDSMAEEMTVKGAKGAVAYIGSTITANWPFLEIYRSFCQAIYLEGKTLGGAWRNALVAYYTKHPRPNPDDPANTIDSNYPGYTVLGLFIEPWRYALFGDPSLRVGGVPPELVPVPNIAFWNEVPGGGTTDVAVSAVEFKDKLYLFGKGIDNKCIYVNSLSNRGDWSGWSQVGGTTDMAVSPVEFNGKLYLFSKGIGDKQIYVNAFDGLSWSGYSRVSDFTTDVAVSPVVFNGKLYLFSKGIEDKRIYVNSTPNGSSWSGFSQFPASGVTDVAVSPVVFNGRLYLFSKGIEDKQIYVNSTPDGSSWSGFSQVPGSGTTDVAVGVVVYSGTTGLPDGLRLMAKGIDDNRLYLHILDNQGHWTHQGSWDRSLSILSTPVAARFSRDLITFAVSRVDHRIYCHREYFVG